MYRVVITDEAYSQVQEIYLWIAKRAPQAAARWFARLMKTISTLERFPERCTIAPEGEAFGIKLHQLFYGKRSGIYRMLFVIHHKTVTVLHVIHGSKQFLGEQEIINLMSNNPDK